MKWFFSGAITKNYESNAMESFLRALFNILTDISKHFLNENKTISSA